MSVMLWIIKYIYIYFLLVRYTVLKALPFIFINFYRLFVKCKISVTFLCFSQGSIFFAQGPFTSESDSGKWKWKFSIHPI